MGTPTIGSQRTLPESRTLSGEPIEPLYTPADLPEYERIGVPGQYPYTRGVYESM
jgi:methylmalonyl-CoA mutase N-terminal domain/subunit